MEKRVTLMNSGLKTVHVVAVRFDPVDQVGFVSVIESAGDTGWMEQTLYSIDGHCIGFAMIDDFRFVESTVEAPLEILKRIQQASIDIYREMKKASPTVSLGSSSVPAKKLPRF